MTPCPSSERLQALLAGELPEDELVGIAAHVENCAACQAALDRLSEPNELGTWRGRADRAAGANARGPALDRVLREARDAATPRLGADETQVDAAIDLTRHLGPPLRAGELGSLGAFRVIGELGRGGMGIVFEAFDDELGRRVAIKMLRPDRGDAASRVRFVREAQAAAKIRHENVVAVYAVASPPDGLPFFVMEHVAGPTLRDVIERGPRLSPRDAADLCARVADGLAAAHGAGLVHRDVKPSNILLGSRQLAVGSRAEKPDGTPSSLLPTAYSLLPLLSDFGLARLTSLPPGSTLTRDGMIAGTPAYMSPEQAREPDRIDARSDVYSLGMTLYEMLTGEVPFRGEPHMVLRQVEFDEPRPPRRLNDAVPVDLETICLKAMAKEADRRYQSALEFADDLRRWLGGEPILARAAGSIERLRLWARRSPRVATLAGVVAALLVLVAAGSTIASFLLASANRQIESERAATARQADRAERSATDARMAEAAARDLAELAREAERLATAAAESAGQQRTLAIETVNTLIFKVQEQLGDQPGTLKLKQQILETALANLEKIAAAAEQSKDAGGPADRSAIVAHRRLGDTFRTLARADLARRQYEQMLELSQRQRDSSVGGADDHVLLDYASIAHNAIGQLLWDANDFRGANARFEQALEITRRLAESHPESSVYRRGVIVTRNNIADVLLKTGEYPAAIARFRESLAETEQLAASNPGDTQFRGDLGFIHSRLSLLCQGTREFDASAEHGRLSLEISQEFAAADPTNIKVRRAVLSSRATLASLEICRRNGDKAAELAESVQRDTAAASAADPDNLRLRGDVYRSWNTVGYAHLCRSDYASADRAFREMQAIIEDLAPREPPGGTSPLALATSCLQLASVASLRGKLDDALRYFTRLIDLLAPIESAGRLQDPIFRAWWEVREPLLAAFRRIVERGIESSELTDPTDDPATRAMLLAQRALWLAIHGRHAEAVALADEVKPFYRSSVLGLGGLTGIYSLCLRAIDAEMASRPGDELLQSRRRAVADAAVATLDELLRLDPSATFRLDFDPIMWPVIDEAAARAAADAADR